MRTQPLVTWLVPLITRALAIGQSPTVTFEPSPGALALASKNQSVQIMIEDGDWTAVAKAANDLALDFGRVTGRNGTVLKAGATVGAGGLIIVGTLGRSPIIDQLVQGGKIQTNATVGQWESFTSSIINSPIPGVPRALVIVGMSHHGLIV